MKKANLVLMIIRSLYLSGLRDLLVEAVKRTPEKWDDSVVQILDCLLGFPAEAKH